LLSLPSSNQFSSQPLVSPVQRSAKLMTRAQKMQQMAAMNDCLRLNQHTSCFPCTQTCSIHVLEWFVSIERQVWEEAALRHHTYQLKRTQRNVKVDIILLAKWN
jgi:hypothetical protein